MAKFKVGDRVRTVHPMPVYNGHFATVIHVYERGGGGSDSYGLRIEPTSHKDWWQANYPRGELSYSEGYLEAAPVLSPFEQQIQDYIHVETSAAT